jgi:hypothetical protein
MPTAETTLISASGNQRAAKKSLTSDARLDNEANLSEVLPPGGKGGSSPSAGPDIAPTLRCPMAEAVARWVRDDVAPTITTFGEVLRGVETLDSFDCCRRNSVAARPRGVHAVEVGGRGAGCTIETGSDAGNVFLSASSSASSWCCLAVRSARPRSLRCGLLRRLGRFFICILMLIGYEAMTRQCRNDASFAAFQLPRS